MNTLESRMLLFQDRKGRLLQKTGERDSVSFVGGLAHFQQVVIEPTTLFKGFVELLLLLLGRIETVLIHFQHIPIVGQTEQECKREAAPHLPQRRNAAFIPMDKSPGLSAAGVGNPSIPAAIEQNPLFKDVLLNLQWRAPREKVKVWLGHPITGV